MIRRPRRSVPATIVGLVVLAVCVLVVVAVVQSLLGRQPFVTLPQLLAVSGGQTWSSATTITVAIVVAVLGLILLVVALRPGTPTVLPLARLTDHDGSPIADAGVRRKTLAKDLTTAVSTVSGVTSATVQTGRRAVTARITTASGDPSAVSDQVHERLTDRLAEIGPASSPRVRVQSRRDRNT